MWASGIATDYIDLLDRIDAFLTENGSAFGLAYAGVGNGTMTGPTAGMGPMGGALSIAETWTITALDATTFSVVGSVSGPYLNATVGVPFTATKIQFTINAGSTPFVASDTFTISTAPKWIARRREMGATASATQGNTGIYGVENLLDGKVTDPSGNRHWEVRNPITIPQDIEITLVEAKTIVEYGIMAGYYEGYAASAWTFDYWNGSTWVTLDTRSGQNGWQRDEIRTFSIASPVSATKYRLHITATPQTNLTALGRIVLRTASGGIGVEHSQIIWEAPGHDGNSQIFCGARHLRRLDADYFDFELAMFDGYTASAGFNEQPGAQRFLYLPLINVPIPYWLIANGRRLIIVAKVNAQYEVGYLGFYDPFFSPNQVPYPAAIGGTIAIGGPGPTYESTKYRWSNSSDEHRMPTHSDPRGSGGPALANHHLRVRKLNGVWQGMIASSNDNFQVTPTASDGSIWPYNGDFNLLDSNVDGSTALWPVLLNEPTPNTMGKLDGIYAISGQGLTAETLLRLGAIDHLVLPNIFRTDRNDFLAVALD
jgi:hypothetical protein